MQLARRLACLLLITIVAGTAQAKEQADPFELVPAHRQAALKITRPRLFVESILENEPVRRLQNFEAVRELMGSTRVHLLRQFLAYYEQQLDANRLELLDRLAGAGIGLG